MDAFDVEPELPADIERLLSDMSCRERRKWVDAWARHRHRRKTNTTSAVAGNVRHREFCPLSPEVLALVSNPALLARAKAVGERRREQDHWSLFSGIDAERALELAAREMGLADDPI